MAHKYDGEHFQVVLMNMRDGSVQGHAHGCADLKRGVKKFSEPSQADDFMDVHTKADAWLDYNSDFLAEGGPENAYEITWLPCAKEIPEGDTEALYNQVFGESEEAEETPALTPVSTTKVGTKWTYIYAPDGSLIAEVRNDQYEAVRASLLALHK